MGGLSTDADYLTDAGPTGSGATGHNDGAIEVCFSLPQFSRCPAERL